MAPFLLPADTFGDRFTLEALPLARRPSGYAVQMLDTDKLLDQLSGAFLPVRSAPLNGIFDSFDEAYAAAHNWVTAHCPNPDDHQLAIVPVSFDNVLQRHVLIYGVLCGQP